jgi:hypothetical protein
MRGDISQIIRPNGNASVTRNNASVISFYPRRQSFCLIQVGVKIAVGVPCLRILTMLCIEYLPFLI